MKTLTRAGGAGKPPRAKTSKASQPEPNRPGRCCMCGTVHSLGWTETGALMCAACFGGRVEDEREPGDDLAIDQAIDQAAALAAGYDAMMRGDYCDRQGGGGWTQDRAEAWGDARDRAQRSELRRLLEDFQAGDRVKPLAEALWRAGVRP